MISVIMCTARRDPGYKHLADSLALNAERVGVEVELVCVDENLWRGPTDELLDAVRGRFKVTHVPPKPNVWRGPNRLTKRDYWNKQSALNTGVCYAKYGRLAFVDDNVVLGENWLRPHVDAVQFPEPLSVAGAYRYWHPGVVVDGCKVTGRPHEPGDHRLRDQPAAGPCHTGWLYGGNCSFPLNAILACNGWEELLAGSGGLEDSEFSVRIGRVTRTFFVPDSIAEYLSENTETVGEYVGGTTADIHQIPATEPAKRCKGFEYRDPNDVIHWMTFNHLAIWRLTGHKLGRHPDGVHYMPVYDPTLVGHKNRSVALGNGFDLRELRNRIQGGGTFPVPTRPVVDWRDGQPLSEM